MPLTPVAGSTRLRAFQLGLESAFKTPVPATRRMPWSVVPTANPNWTFPNADTGTLAQAMAPYRTVYDVTAAVSGQQLSANDASAVFSAGVMGGITPAAVGGTGQSWAFAPSETSQDVFDTYTGEWFDDASADAWQGFGGLLESFTLTYPQNFGPITLDAAWRFAGANYGGVTPTPGLSVDKAPTWLYMADTALYINDTGGTIGTTKIADTLYDASVSLNNSLDQKRFANGNSVRFDLSGYGRGERIANFMINVTKDAAAVAEAVKWISANAAERFLELRTTSTVNAGLGTPYSMSIRIPGYWITRAESTVNSNTGFQLTGHNVADAGLGYSFRAAVVNTMSAPV